MNDSNDSSSSATRPTLRLKVPPRQTAPATKAPPQPPTPSKANLKPGARWSDEYKDRMQADMNALTSR
jgi:hypothetical protein